MPRPEIVKVDGGYGTYSWTDGMRHHKPESKPTGESPYWTEVEKDPEGAFYDCCRKGFWNLAERIMAKYF